MKCFLCVKYQILNVWLICAKVNIFCFRGSCDRMIVGFTTTYAISTYHHLTLLVRIPPRWGVLNTTLCDQVCQQRVGGFLWGTLVSSTNKTDLNNITEIFLKVVLNTITPNPIFYFIILKGLTCSKCTYWSWSGHVDALNRYYMSNALLRIPY